MFFGIHYKERKLKNGSIVEEIALNEDEIERYFRVDFASEEYNPDNWNAPNITTFHSSRCSNDYLKLDPLIYEAN